VGKSAARGGCANFGTSCKLNLFDGQQSAIVAAMTINEMKAVRLIGDIGNDEQR